MNSVCILIPSHERPDYLRRCFFYYASFMCNIVICDSSKSEYQEPLPKNITYYHLPGKQFAEKVIFALNLISEELVALVPDDDFLFEDSLRKVVQLLHRNPALRACVGDVLVYPDKPPFRVIGHASGSLANAISISAKENIATYLGQYHQILWSAFRRDTLLLCFHGIMQAQFANDNFFELSIATLCAGKGGIRYLDDFWILREVTQGAHWGSRHVTISRESVGSMEEDVRKFRQMIDGILFTGAADLALTSYLAHGNGTLEKSPLMIFVRVLWPRVIRWVRRKITAQPALEIDPRFNQIRKAIGY